MASHQISNQQRRQSGVSQGPQSAQRPTATADYAKESQRDYGSLSDVAEQASDYWTQGEDYMRELVRDREGTAIMVALAAGVGVGLVIGASLGRSHREPRSWRERLAAEGFGRRIMDRIEGMIPDALAEHFAK
jgi:hypothetical protein